jgi:hypothetical protein
MNNCISQSTQKTSYGMVFGQPVHNNHYFWQELHKQSKNTSIVNEEEIDQSFTGNSDSFNESVFKVHICFFGFVFFF